jgi:superfamily II DNA or RNA helicase
LWRIVRAGSIHLRNFKEAHKSKACPLEIVGIFYFMKKELYTHQKEFLDEILQSLKINNSVCAQLSTGGGKTVVFTELVSQLNSKTLILVDNIDLVNQTVYTFQKQGIDVGCVLAGNKKFPENKVIVAMVKSLWNRRKKLPLFDYCVIDEAHIWEFNKLFEFLPNCKRIGFTATPVRLKRTKIDEEYSEVETMSQWYDDIVCGKPISWLMEKGYLIREENEYIEFDSMPLKTDASGEFTASSLKEVFQSESYKNALRKTFDKLCDGKKTMIFTSSTETNAIYANLLNDKNVKTYDSVNNESKEREGIVEWFRDTPDAILINTGCFTKGFDICDVEVIFMARATKSLSLWIQIAGRGARKTSKIEKPYFLLIDGGNNNKEHGIFSFDRDWKKIFFDKQRKSFLKENYECEECGYNFEPKEKKCPNCGAEIPEKEPIEDEEKEQKEFVIIGKKNKPLMPTIDLNFHIDKGHTKYQALKILRDKWVTFLYKQEITLANFEYHERNRTFYLKFKKHIFPLYLQVLRSILTDGKHSKFDSLCEKILIETKKKKYEI